MSGRACIAIDIDVDEPGSTVDDVVAYLRRELCQRLAMYHPEVTVIDPGTATTRSAARQGVAS